MVVIIALALNFFFVEVKGKKVQMTNKLHMSEHITMPKIWSQDEINAYMEAEELQQDCKFGLIFNIRKTET